MMASSFCCLLCLDKFDEMFPHLDINSAEGQELEAQQVIEQYFWEEVNTASTTAPIVCMRCWDMVSTFHQFYLRVQRAHIALVHSDIACEFESGSEGGKPLACEEPTAETIDFERLLLPPNESDSFAVEQHINGVNEKEVEFVDVHGSRGEEHSDETEASSEETEASSDESDSETERLQKQERKIWKKWKADAFIAEVFKISCDLCGVAAETFAELQIHFQTEHETRGYVVCCGQKMMHRATLVDHLCLHRNPQHFKCPKCGKVVSSSTALRNHIRAHKDTREPLFKCDNCPKSFLRRSALTRHAESHVQERLHPCEECGKTYPTKKAANHHFKMIHQNAYTKICDACGKAVRTNRQLELHMQQHTGPKSPVKCDKCDRVLSSKRGLKLHMITVHQAEPQTCPICFKVSQSLRAHQHHMNYMHKLTPKHACALCDKVFKRRDHLKEHTRSHTKEVSFACIFCQRMYVSGNSRYMHYKKKHPKEWEERKKALRLEKAAEQPEQ